MEVSKENLKIITVEDANNTGIFSMEPLPTGFGNTLGNTLRRVLLTSIKGAAITQVKINGANHQFTTIPGVKEDIVELTLNLKKIRCKLHTNNPVVMTLKKKGPGSVTAGDIQTSADVEIMNKDTHIATLADNKTEINMELIVEPGVGYSPMEERQTSKIGVIVLDAIYSPIVNVTYNVEPARFGGKTDLDKIVITVQTDGSISAKQAILDSAKILKEYYEEIIRWNQESIAAETEVADMPKKKVEDVSIEELPLQTRTINALKKNGISTLHEIAAMSDEQISDVKNLGEKSIEEIKKLLKKEGLRA